MIYASLSLTVLPLSLSLPLQFNCDVNCCCDLDCNDEILKAFRCATDLDIDDFYHDEGLERCSNSVDSSLLCIAHDNVPAIDFKVSDLS
jgi:hypothetical protein